MEYFEHISGDTRVQFDFSCQLQNKIGKELLTSTGSGDKILIRGTK